MGSALVLESLVRRPIPSLGNTLNFNLVVETTSVNASTNVKHFIICRKYEIGDFNLNMDQQSPMSR